MEVLLLGKAGVEEELIPKKQLSVLLLLLIILLRLGLVEFLIGVLEGIAGL